MDNIVTINNTKSQTVEFDITTEGLETKGMKVYLMVKAKGMELRFTAKKKEGDTFAVKLPVLSNLLDRTAYDCSVEVVADGYHFIPMRGTLNVTGSAKVEAKVATTNKEAKAEEKAKKEETKAKKEKIKEQVVQPGSHSTVQGEKSIKQIADELMAQKEADVVEETVDTAKDDKLKEILKEEAFKPKKSKKPLFKKSAIKESTEEKVEKPTFAKSDPIIEKVEEAVEEVIEETVDPKSEKVNAILEEAGITPSKPKRKVKFSIKTKPLNS